MTAPQYNPNVPRPGDSIATSQPDFLNNFGKLFTAFATNHVDLEDVLAGNHTIVEMPAQTSAFLSNAGEMSIYTREVDDAGTQVYLKYQGTTEEFQFSCYQIYSVPPIEIPPLVPLLPTTYQTLYFTFLPGRILLYFGTYGANIQRFSNNRLTLIPPVARDIMTCDFCSTSTTPTDKPIVNVIKENDGRILKMVLSSSSSVSVIANPTHYFVMAKI